ncbi:hypothetical protein IW262DRAFT_1497580 [Armillaria fumosa]|nr:hypothetical protein IW262DRAFT_1497580 [Armillaria fumosa]
MVVHFADAYLNSGLSEAAITLTNALLSSGNIDVFLPIVTFPCLAPTINDVNFLTKSFPKAVSVDKAPHFMVALDPTIARVEVQLPWILIPCSPALRGDCLVTNKDEWLSDPGYKVERALFSGIIGIAFVGSPIDPILPEISYFTLFTEEERMYKIDLEKAAAWIEMDEPGLFDLEGLPTEEVATEEMHLQTCAKVNTLCATTIGKLPPSSQQ